MLANKCLGATAVLDTMARIDGVWTPTRKHKGIVLEEILDVWSFEQSRGRGPVIARRAAEAYKYVGRPRAYGRMMTTVARKEHRAAR